MVLFKVLAKKICERWSFTVSEFSCEFPQLSHTLLYKIITVRLGYNKFCTRSVPKILTGLRKTQRMGLALALTFLEQYHKDDVEFLSHFTRVTGDETWISFVNVETKEQLKQ
jgi:hypothetical protein